MMSGGVRSTVAPPAKPETGRVWEALSIQVLAEPPTTATEAGVASLVVDNRNDIRDFLASRRARITPERAGLPAYGGNRRVKGLRREEVALLAGVRVDYYTRLERGNLKGGVRGRPRRGRPGAAARRGPAGPPVRPRRGSQHDTAHPRRPTPLRVRCSVQRLLDAMTGAPAFLRNGRLDILAANRLGYALYSEVFTDRCPRAASSASGGQRTTSASTAPGSNDCITASSATLTSRSRRWNCRPTRA